MFTNALSPMERIEYNEKRPLFMQSLMDEFKKLANNDPAMKLKNCNFSYTGGAVQTEKFICSWVDADPINNCFQIRFVPLGANLHQYDPELELKADYTSGVWKSETGEVFTNGQLAQYCISKVKEMENSQ